MRIVSFLPSATEMVYALGLGDQLVGVTHECDYPPEARGRPVVVRSAIETRGLSSQQIDEAVSRALKAGQSLYVVDEEKLRELAPDLILTQDLCQVCAPSGNEIGRVIKFLPVQPKIVWLTPTCLADIFENINQVGDATGTMRESIQLIDQLKERVKAISNKSRSLESHPRVFCMEWLSPPLQCWPLDGGTRRVGRWAGWACSERTGFAAAGLGADPGLPSRGTDLEPLRISSG